MATTTPLILANYGRDATTGSFIWN